MFPGFDSVSSPFLLNILRSHGFRPRLQIGIHFLTGFGAVRLLSSHWLVPSPDQWSPELLHLACSRASARGSLIPLLFLLVMDVLNAMMDYAELNGVFEKLDRWGVRHRLSLYADDMAIFLRPKKNLNWRPLRLF